MWFRRMEEGLDLDDRMKRIGWFFIVVGGKEERMGIWVFG